MLANHPLLHRYLASLNSSGMVDGPWQVLSDPLLVNVNFRNVHVQGDLVVASGSMYFDARSCFRFGSNRS